MTTVSTPDPSTLSGSAFVELTGLKSVACRDKAIMISGAPTVGCNWLPDSVVRKVTVHADGVATVNPRPPAKADISVVVPMWWIRKQSNGQRLIANHLR